MVVEVSGLKFSRGGFSLECEKIQLEDGLITGIIGKNGSGKSTLLKLISGGLKSSHGNIIVDGKPVGSYSARELSRKIAFVQQEILDPLGFTVREVMSVSGYSRGQSSKAMADALRQCEIEHLADRKFSDLSGGERRLVTLAAAMYQDSSMLLLDEPTTFLDVENELLIHDIIRKAKEMGKTVAVVMHNLQEIHRLADRLILMVHGRIIAQGGVEEVMTEDNLREGFGVDFEIIDTPGGKWFRGRRGVEGGDL